MMAKLKNCIQDIHKTYHMIDSVTEVLKIIEMTWIMNFDIDMALLSDALNPA